MPDPTEVRAMFDRIAGRYDLMNRVMTMGIDQRWRNAAIRAAQVDPSTRALDICCGTGDISFFLARAGAEHVTGLDFSPKMLEQARERQQRSAIDAPDRRVTFVEGDAMKLPFDDGHFDAVTVSFGIRNVSEIDVALRECARVLRPGGRFVCLEITRPSSKVANLFYEVWFDRIVPTLGGLISRNKSAYTYLPESTKHFPRPKQFADKMTNAGFSNVSWRNFGGGIVALHSGRIALPQTVPSAEKPRETASV